MWPFRWVGEQVAGGVRAVGGAVEGAVLRGQLGSETTFKNSSGEQVTLTVYGPTGLGSWGYHSTIQIAAGSQYTEKSSPRDVVIEVGGRRHGDLKKPTGSLGAGLGGSWIEAVTVHSDRYDVLLPRASGGITVTELGMSEPIASCRRRFAELREQRPPPAADVIVHAYDISFNQNFAWHVGLSVFGIEWSMDGYCDPLAEQLSPASNTFKGVKSSTLVPHEDRGWFQGGSCEYRSLHLGATSKTLDDVEAILVHLMTHEYHPGGKTWATVTNKTYTLATHNCQDFAQSFLARLRDGADEHRLKPIPDGRPFAQSRKLREYALY